MNAVAMLRSSAVPSLKMHDSMPFNQNLEAVRQRYERLAPIYPCSN
jgi:hypothetical protein